MVMKQEVKKRLSSEATAAANRSGQWKNQMRRVAHNGCCRRVAQTRALCSVLWKLIISEELMKALNNIEIPLVNFVLPVYFAEGKVAFSGSFAINMRFRTNCPNNKNNTSD